MPIFETEDEWKEDWFENQVDKYGERIEKEAADREASGFANKTDEEWLIFKEHREHEKEMAWHKKMDGF